MRSNTSASTEKGSERRILAVGVVWAVTYITALALLKLELAFWLRTGVAIAPVVPFALFMVITAQVIRDMDELQRRIHLEALALAYPFAIALLMLLGLLEVAIGLNPNDWSYRHVWPLLALFYFTGLWIARKRYQ